jgi:hypothetical protein
MADPQKARNTRMQMVQIRRLLPVRTTKDELPREQNNGQQPNSHGLYSPSSDRVIFMFEQVFFPFLIIQNSVALSPQANYTD